MKKIGFGILLAAFVFGFLFASCDNSTSGGSSGFDGVIKIISVNAYYYGPYDDDPREHGIIILDTNFPWKDYDSHEEPYDLENDFVLKINEANIPLTYGDVSWYGDEIRFSWLNKDLFTIGNQYKIQVIYTENPDRKCKVWSKNGNEYILNSFDIGEKTVTVKKW